MRRNLNVNHKEHNDHKGGNAAAGMTLVEVLLATMILAICMGGLMGGMTTSLEVFRASQFVAECANVLSLGEIEYPMIVKTDPLEDLVVEPVSSLVKGWTFERTVEEDEDEDGLFVVRTKVKKGRGGLGAEDEFVSLIYYAQ